MCTNEVQWRAGEWPSRFEGFGGAPPRGFDRTQRLSRVGRKTSPPPPRPPMSEVAARSNSLNSPASKQC
jgi:hypothetical protein